MVVNSNKNDNKNINNDNDRVNTNVNIKIDLGQALQKPKKRVKRRKPKVKPEDLMKGMGGANFSGMAPVPLGATYMPSSSTYDTPSQLPAFRPQYQPQPMIMAPPVIPSLPAPPVPSPAPPPEPPVLPPAEQPRFIREGVLYDPKSKQTLVLPKAGETGKPALLDPISESRYLPMISEVEETRREALAQMRATGFPPSIASPSAEFDIVFDSSGGLRTVPRLPPEVPPQAQVSPVPQAQVSPVPQAQVSPTPQEPVVNVRYIAGSSHVVTQSGKKLFDKGNAITTLEGKYYVGDEEVSKDFIKALVKKRQTYESLSTAEKSKFTKGLTNQVNGQRVSKEVFDIYQKSKVSSAATAQQASGGGLSPASFDIFGAIGQALSSAVTGGIVKATTPLTAAIPSPAAGQTATPTPLRFPEGPPPPAEKKKNSNSSRGGSQ